MADPQLSPSHHPSQERLLDYASGALREPLALLVATHLALCPACRREIAALEAVGGALLDELPPEPVADDSLAHVLARLDRPEAPDRPSGQAGEPDPAAAGPVLPQPLRGYVGGSLDRLAWRRLGPIAEARLLPDFDQLTTRLLRVGPGAAIPDHEHSGSELTLVLQGGFSDVTGHYLRGDVAEADSTLDHRPVADDGEECVCLVVTDGPLRLTGPLGRLLNPFIRI
jgi:putative transcriptional regulator